MCTWPRLEPVMHTLLSRTYYCLYLYILCVDIQSMKCPIHFIIIQRAMWYYNIVWKKYDSSVRLQCPLSPRWFTTNPPFYSCVGLVFMLATLATYIRIQKIVTCTFHFISEIPSVVHLFICSYRYFKSNIIAKNNTRHSAASKLAVVTSLTYTAKNGSRTWFIL